MGALSKVIERLMRRREAADEAAGALERKLSGKTEAQFLQQAEKVGDVYTDELFKNPQTFFERGRYFGDTEAELAQQFGTNLPGRPSVGLVRRSLPGRTPDGKLQILEETHTPWGEVDRAAKEYLNFTLSGAAGATVREFDTADLAKGSNAGQKLYGAAYGALRLDPGAINHSSLLTPVNTARRSYNMAAAIARAPELGNQIAVYRRQLPGTLTARRYHELSPKTQIGALQLSGASKTLGMLHKNLDGNMSSTLRKLFEANTRGSGLESSMVIDGYTKRADRLGELADILRMLSESGGFSDKPLQDLAARLKAYNDGPAALGGVDLQDVALGDRTRRRIGLTLKALDDVPLERGFTDRLEYRQGGLAALRRRLGSRKKT